MLIASILHNTLLFELKIEIYYQVNNKRVTVMQHSKCARQCHYMVTLFDCPLSSFLRKFFHCYVLQMHFSIWSVTLYYTRHFLPPSCVVNVTLV